MLRLGREALADWRQAKDKSAASRHAGRMLAFTMGRLDELATSGRLPADWAPNTRQNPENQTPPVV